MDGFLQSVNDLGVVVRLRGLLRAQFLLHTVNAVVSVTTCKGDNMQTNLELLEQLAIAILHCFGLGRALACTEAGGPLRVQGR